MGIRGSTKCGASASADQQSEDMKKTLECLAPREKRYGHDDFDVRTVNMEVGEQPNGHAHCKALLLRTSETLNIVDGQLRLGRWQRIFFIELDRSRPRTVSVMVMGAAEAAMPWERTLPAMTYVKCP